MNDEVVDEANNYSTVIKEKKAQEQNQEIRSVVQSFGKKRNSTDGLVKYIIFTEIPENKIQEVLKDQYRISKCDAIAFLYENDKDHIEFVRQNISKFSAIVPKIIIQTKMDLIQQQREQITF